MTTPWFEELDFVATPMGELVLQRRRVAALNEADVYEVKLHDDYLMSSLFFEAEVALADLALQQLNRARCDVVVGGLGLGFTAAAALRHDCVQQLVIVEALAPVIDWHRRALVPNGATLTGDPRCHYQHGDFFAMAAANGFDPDIPNRRFDAILLDVDHTPDQHLAPHHAAFYTEEGLQQCLRFLLPGGVLAIWSNEPPEWRFLEMLKGVFGSAEGHTITFPNPIQDRQATNGIYIAQDNTTTGRDAT